MPISGGADLSELRPLDAQGNLPDESGEPTLGSHREGFEALNVRNPQPGMFYFWQRRDRSQIRRSYLKGAEVVPPDAPESMGEIRDPKVACALDGVPGYDDVVLMRMPIEKRAKDLRDRQELANRQLQGAESDFIDKGSAVEDHYAGQTGAPIRYRRRDHRVYTDEG